MFKVGRFGLMGTLAYLGWSNRKRIKEMLRNVKSNSQTGRSDIGSSSISGRQDNLNNPLPSGQTKPFV